MSWRRVTRFKISFSRRGRSLGGNNARWGSVRVGGQAVKLSSPQDFRASANLHWGRTVLSCKGKWQPYIGQSSGHVKVYEVTFNSYGALTRPATNSWIITRVINRIIRKISSDISRPWARLQARYKCITGNGKQTKTLHQATDVIWEVNAESVYYDSTQKSGNISVLLNIIR